MVLAQKQGYRQMEQNTELQNKPSLLQSVNLQQRRQKYTNEIRKSETRNQ